MLISVPQHIDVEDKIVGPLTAKQLGWVAALGVILLIMWNMTPKIVFFILGFPLSIFFIALAFYKPYGEPLGSFMIFGIMYFFKPKVYFWKRTPQKNVNEQKKQVVETHLVQKQVTSESFRELAELLDSEGSRHSEGIEKILKQVPNKK
jgi:membrane protein implicated in regulation of membrane protease activity